MYALVFQWKILPLQGVEMGDLCVVVKFKDRVQPQHSQEEGQQVHGCVAGFPGQPGPYP